MIGSTVDKIEQLFNMDEEQIKQVLQNAINTPVSSYSFKINKTKQSASGIIGEYTIPTFAISAQDGKTYEKDLFIRRQPEGQRGFAQAHHYHYLESQHIPTPKLYGWFIDDEGREVLCLEYLSEIIENDQAFFQDSENCRSFLELMAKFTANCPRMDYLALVGRDMAYRGD